MKKIQACFILMIVCTAFIACYKDKGNYDYHPINELTFANFDTTNGYRVEYGETLTVSPQLQGSLDPDGTKHAYTYEWSFDLPDRDTVISTEKVLNLKMTVNPGTYVLQYKVIDKETGVQFRTRTQLLVTTKIFEGYLVLSDVNGASRLDMLSYYRTDNVFEPHIDVLAEMGSTLPPQGKPIQVFCMETMYVAVATPQSYRVYLVSETGTNYIDAETFGYTQFNSIRYEMTGALPDNFKPSRFTGGARYGFLPAMIMTEGNDIYTRAYAAPTFGYVPTNIYPGASKPFKAWPQAVSKGSDGTIVIYNMDKRAFTTSSFDAVNVADVPPGLKYPTGKDMVYMEDLPTSDQVYAVLKDPGLPNYYIVRFITGNEPNYYDAVTNATDFDKATAYAVSPDLGYLFYAVGGKLYEYDLSLKKSFLMLDKGTHVISHISFQRFFNRALYSKYAAWEKLLTVGSYDPAGAAGSNGTMELYSVPPVNAALTRTNIWTGFGRIASVSYRERR